MSFKKGDRVRVLNGTPIKIRTGDIEVVKDDFFEDI